MITAVFKTINSPFGSVMRHTLKSVLRGQAKQCIHKFCLDQFQGRSNVHMDMLVELFKSGVSKGNTSL